MRTTIVKGKRKMEGKTMEKEENDYEEDKRTRRRRD